MSRGNNNPRYECYFRHAFVEPRQSKNGFLYCPDCGDGVIYDIESGHEVWQPEARETTENQLPDDSSTSTIDLPPIDMRGARW